MVARADDPLALYRSKRDFSKTREPSGGKASGKALAFVVQKHDATRLHYDFRLELDGVLKSWAVTRGPSPNPDDKRLAVRTEDHPMDYAGFEGIIPKGEYGGGTVMLWDRGTWEPVPGKDPRKTLADGHLHFILHGERMKGEWLLVRMKPRKGEKRENWLLRKVEDDHAGGSDDLTGQMLTSVDTGRTMAAIANDDKPAGKERTKATKALKTQKTSKTAKTSEAKAPRGKMPAFHPPQLATLSDSVPPGNAWLHEMKYDGYRVLLAIGGGKARTYTRTGLDWSDRFSAIVRAAEALDVQSALIDGELVALDAKGHPDFQTLQAAIKEGARDVVFQAFDLLALDGEDLTALPLIERKERLEKLFGKGRSQIQYSQHVRGSGEQLFSELCRQGFEGVVSKRADAPYVGARNGAWLKTKCISRQEFIIIGWTPSDKSRGFRSLLLGVHDQGTLRYAGKVGTGFDMDEIDRLLDLMRPLEQKKAAADVPRQFGRGAHWIKPQLVAEIAFTEFTGDGRLRHPSYIGLREDKPAADVVVEHEQPAEKAAVQPVIRISNPDRVIFPESHITKGELAAHYQAVAEIMLPWAGHRPISLVRCPQGRAKKCFFQKHDAGSFGDAVHHVPILEKDGHEEPYLYVDDAKGLLTCVQMGTIEFHGWGSRVDAVEQPDRLVFDLDPDEAIGFADVARAAEHIRAHLDEIGLRSFPMLSGGKGVHIVVPLTPDAEWPAAKDFCHRFALALSEAEPDRFTAALPKAQRKGKIFIDYLRNQRGATAVMPYSARARAAAPVAVPISWEELKGIDTAARWHVGDAAELIERARSRQLAGWGIADQRLPDL